MLYIVIIALAGIVLSMAYSMGSNHKAKKHAEQELQKVNEEIKKEAVRKETVAKVKEEIFQEGEHEKKKLNNPDSVKRFNAVNELLRK